MGTINRYMATLFSISAEHRARFNLNNKQIEKTEIIELGNRSSLS